MSTLPKLTYRFKIPAGFFAEIDKSNPKTHMEMQKNTNDPNNLNKEEQSWKTSHFKSYKATVIKPVWYWHKNK